MNTQDFWTLTVDDVFNIKGRGRIAVGDYVGTTMPRTGDVFAMPDGTEVGVRGVECSRGAHGFFRNVGLLVRDEVEVAKGMQLRQVEPEDV